MTLNKDNIIIMFAGIISVGIIWLFLSAFMPMIAVQLGFLISVFIVLLGLACLLIGSQV